MWINRIAAALALISAILHLRMGIGTAAGSFVAVMAIVCLFCAVDLWRSMRNRAWVMVAGTSAVMLLAHTPGLTGHHHSGHISTATASMTAASSVAAAELVLAAAVVFFRTRRIPLEFRPHRLQESA